MIQCSFPFLLSVCVCACYRPKRSKTEHWREKRELHIKILCKNGNLFEMQNSQNGLNENCNWIITTRKMQQNKSKRKKEKKTLPIHLVYSFVCFYEYNIHSLCVCFFLIFDLVVCGFLSIDYDHTFTPGTQNSNTPTATLSAQQRKMCFCCTFAHSRNIQELIRKYHHANDNCSSLRVCVFFFITWRV